MVGSIFDRVADKVLEKQDHIRANDGEVRQRLDGYPSVILLDCCAEIPDRFFDRNRHIDRLLWHLRSTQSRKVQQSLNEGFHPLSGLNDAMKILVGLWIKLASIIVGENQ